MVMLWRRWHFNLGIAAASGLQILCMLLSLEEVLSNGCTKNESCAIPHLLNTNWVVTVKPH